MAKARKTEEEDSTAFPSMLNQGPCICSDMHTHLEALKGCIKAPKGSTSLPKGFRWENFLMGESGAMHVF